MHLLVLPLYLSPVALPPAFGIEHVPCKAHMHCGYVLPPFLGADVGYLSLLDANYDRRPPNKYLAAAVNYTVHFQWIQCVFWDKTEWRSEGLCPQPGTSPERVNCRYESPARGKPGGFNNWLRFRPHLCLSPGPSVSGVLLRKLGSLA